VHFDLLVGVWSCVGRRRFYPEDEDYLQQQHRQSAIQEQIPQQMQQIKERTKEATMEAIINQNHQTGRHSLCEALQVATTSAH